MQLSDIIIKEQIYTGKYTTIYKAASKTKMDPLVLKTKTNQFSQVVKWEMLQKEYQFLSQIQHPNVIKTYGIFEKDRVPYLTLEAYSGYALNTLTASNHEPLIETRLLHLFIQLSETLAAVHHQGVLHLDITPSNILYQNSTGQIKLIDFDNSSYLDLPVEKSNRATPAYMAPEQARKTSLLQDQRTDLYSLGVTFFELATKSLPFVSDSLLQTTHFHLAKAAPSARSINPHLSVELDRILLKLLQKNPDARYQNAEELRQELEECLNIQSRPRIFHQKRMTPITQLSDQLIEREQEFEEVEKFLNTPVQLNNLSLFIAGSSGIGKTFLIERVLSECKPERLWLGKGKNDPSQNIAYGCFISIINQFLSDILVTEPSTEGWKNKILTGLAENIGLMTDLFPELTLITGQQQQPARIPPREAKDRFIKTFLNLIEAFSSSRPLLLFFDDLQWIDSASLELLNTLIRTPVPNLKIIGTYRDQEPGAASVWQLTLEKLLQEGIKGSIIHLQEIHLSGTTALIAETLSLPPEKVMSLAAACQKKTAGNPFFLRQFFSLLLDQKKIQCSPGRQSWCWQPLEIENTPVTKNVLTLVLQQMANLAPDMKLFLQLASCLGDTVELKSITSILARKTAQVEHLVTEACQMDLLIRKTQQAGEQILFSHDKIQEASYASLSVTGRAKLHLKIALHLMERLISPPSSEALQILVGQFNKALIVIQDPSLRRKIACLNQGVGRETKKATAYEIALNYFEVGQGLLPEDSWQNDRTLTFELYHDIAEAAYFCGEYNKMDQAIQKLQSEHLSPVEKAKIAVIEIEAAVARQQMDEAVQIAKVILPILKVFLPQKPTPTKTLFQLIRTKFHLKKYSWQQLKNLPSLRDPEQLAAMQILTRIIFPTYTSQPELGPFIAFEMVRISLQYGSCSLSPYGFVCYAHINTARGQIEEGYQYGMLAMEIVKTFDRSEVATKVPVIFDIFLGHWKYHLSESLMPLLESYKKGMLAGDTDFAAHALYLHIDYSFMVCDDISRSLKKLDSYEGQFNELKREHFTSRIRDLRQFILNFQIESKDPLSLSTANIDETEILRKYHAHNNGGLIAGFHHAKAMLAYHFGNAQEAYLQMQKATPYEAVITGTAFTARTVFYQGLIAAELLTEASGKIKRKLRSQLNKTTSLVKKWAHHAPMNQAHRFHLLQAENCRLQEKCYEAINHYDQAIELASTHGYLSEEALANELATRFWFKQRNEKQTKFYLAEALSCYARWGADAKVQSLKQQFTSIQLQAPAIGTQNSLPESMTETRALGLLDYTSLLKASQALSGEIVTEKLIRKLMELVLENAGAARGVLIMNHESKLTVEAQGQINEEKQIKVESIQLDCFLKMKTGGLPEGVINWVRRTVKSVLIHNATIDPRFRHDTYIRKWKPLSIICLPLLYQQQLKGILYLENRLLQGAFSDNKIQILHGLASQLMISWENAKMYQQVRQLSTRILSAQEQERKRLSRELHDGLGQSLLAIKLNLQLFQANYQKGGLDQKESLGDILQELTQSIEELREISMDLRPAYLENTSLDHLFCWYASRFSKRTGIQVQIEGDQNLEVPLSIKDNLFRIFQEALSNVVRHAQADSIKVSIKHVNHKITLKINDNGNGMVIETQEFDTGQGLSTMRERTELMGGNYQLTSRSGQGATIEIRVEVP